EARRASSKRRTAKIRKLRKAMRRAITDGGLVEDAGRSRQEVLLDHIGMLYSTGALLDLTPPSPWTPQQPAAPVVPDIGQEVADMSARLADTAPDNATEPSGHTPGAPVFGNEAGGPGVAVGPLSRAVEDNEDMGRDSQSGRLALVPPRVSDAGDMSHAEDSRV